MMMMMMMMMMIFLYFYFYYVCVEYLAFILLFYFDKENQQNFYL